MLFDNFSGTQLEWVLFSLHGTLISSDSMRSTPFVEGTCLGDPCWYAVSGATGKEIAILDLYPNTTSNLVAKRISAIKPVDGAQPAVMCDPTVATQDVGFVCQNGAFVATEAGSR